MYLSRVLSETWLPKENSVFSFFLVPHFEFIPVVCMSSAALTGRTACRRVRGLVLLWFPSLEDKQNSHLIPLFPLWNEQFGFRFGSYRLSFRTYFSPSMTYSSPEYSVPALFLVFTAWSPLTKQSSIILGHLFRLVPFHFFPPPNFTLWKWPYSYLFHWFTTCSLINSG